VSQRPTIQCKPNGPYLVKGLSDFRTSAGQSIATQPVVALCRCGGSANKPFCDGTHQRNGFSGSPAQNADPAVRRKHYRAAGITIHDDRTLCAHAGRCTEGLASVFKYGSEPWIDPAGASVAAIIDVIRQCPSGALTYTLDGPDSSEATVPPAIVISKNGPYEIAGDIELVDSDQVSPGARCTLCRCGGSKNKPFCDGTHWSNGFADERN
jgi:CDGSH-type Zn-finger protein